MKVKGIELFKMIANGKVNQHTRVSVDNYNDCSLDFVFEDGRNIFKWLDEYFEILEDKTEEIEEVDWKDVGYVIGKIYKEFRNGFEEGYTSKETNCMSD